MDDLGRAFETKVRLTGADSLGAQYGEFEDARQIVWCGRPLIIGEAVSIHFHNGGLSSISLQTPNQKHDGELIEELSRHFSSPKTGALPMYPDGKRWLWNDHRSRVYTSMFASGPISGTISYVTLEDRSKYKDKDWNDIESEPVSKNPSDRHVKCPACYGTGTVDAIWQICTNCDGTGERIRGERPGTCQKCTRPREWERSLHLLSDGKFGRQIAGKASCPMCGGKR